jgi:hypothetical protein
MKGNWTMKLRTLTSLASLALAALPLAAGSTACTAETAPTAQDQSAQEQTATQDAAQVIGITPIFAWPAGPIAWTGLNAVWPISIWSTMPITGLAFGVSSAMTNFAVTSANLTSMTITTPWLNAFVPPVATTGLLGAGLFGPAGLIAPAWGFTGAFTPWATGAGFGFGAFGAGLGLTGAWGAGAFLPAATWLTPTLTSSALLFNNIAAMSSLNALTFNVAFTASSVAAQTAFASQAALMNMSALSIFGTTAALATTLPFMSIAFPIVPALGLPTLGLGAAGLGLGAAAFNNPAIPGAI